MTSAEPSTILTLLLAGALLIALLGWRSATRRTSRANRRRQRTALRAESAAERLLAREGYEILERQAIRRWWIEIDGEEHEVFCRADLLLERDRERLVADVKSGEHAPDPRLPATRRQLLEYLLAFRADGVLVVDMSLGVIRRVNFPDLLDED